MLTQHTCTISRYKQLGTNGRNERIIIATNVPCTFVPMSAKAAISNNYSVGFGWDIYFGEDTDVQSGDRLVWAGKGYTVGGSMPYLGFPGVSHVHVTAATEGSRGQ